MTTNNASPLPISKIADGVEILGFDGMLKSHFAALNFEWIRRYFAVEPQDERVLGFPEEEIIVPGGEILFARVGSQIVGTVALKYGSRQFELCKMAVASHVQGQGVGRRLLKSAIDVARQRGAARIVLYTHSSLGPAMHLYESCGFVKTSTSCKGGYARCDTAMELVL